MNRQRLPSGFQERCHQAQSGAATLLNLGLVTVTARAHVGMGYTTPVSVSFSYADIAAQTNKTVTGFTSSLIGKVLGDLQLSADVLGVGIDVPGLGPLVTGIIGALADRSINCWRRRGPSSASASVRPTSGSPAFAATEPYW
jgi:uncharacterized membrane protein